MAVSKEQIETYKRLRGSLELFAGMFFEEMMYSDTPDFHREIYKYLLTEDRVALAAPRGFAKSTITCVFYPLWMALLLVRRDILIISASETLAVEFLRKIRMEICGNEKLRALFGDQQSDKWTENHIVLRNGVNIRAKGAGGQIRGFRPDCILLDDIETDESVESEEQRKKLKDWLFKACLNTLLPGGQLVIIGTLIHPLSVLGDLLETPRTGWIRRKYTAYTDGVESSGHELWPLARPHEWLQARKGEIGSWAFAAEFMNDPRADASAPIKQEQLRYWKELPKQFSCVITVDPAYSEDEKSDFKVAACVAIDQHQNRYLLEYLRTHQPTLDFMDGVLNMFLRYRGMITALGVPDSGTEKEFFRSFCNRAMDRKLSPPIVSLKNTFVDASTGTSIRNKKKRVIASLQPLFEQGRYYIHENHIEARDELLTIGSSRWDDVVDTMSYAEQLLQPMFFDEKKIDNYEEKDNNLMVANYGIE